MGYKGTGGNPFIDGATVFSINEAVDDEGIFYTGEIVLDKNCITADCALGFQLKTNDSEQNKGIAVDIESESTYIDALSLATNEYRYETGTSMASPNVAGVVALLWAQYPEAGYKDIILAVFDGTKSMDSLDGKTCTGGLVNARNALNLLEEWLE